MTPRTKCSPSIPARPHPLKNTGDFKGHEKFVPGLKPILRFLSLATFLRQGTQVIARAKAQSTIFSPVSGRPGLCCCSFSPCCPPLHGGASSRTAQQQQQQQSGQFSASGRCVQSTAQRGQLRSNFCLQPCVQSGGFCCDPSLSVGMVSGCRFFLCGAGFFQ